MLSRSLSSVGGQSTARFAGKRAVVAGVADDKGYGWAIAQMLLHEGVSDLMLATWVPAHRVFGKMLDRRKIALDNPHGANIHLVPLDAAFEYPEEVPEQIACDPKYVQVAAQGYTIS